MPARNLLALIIATLGIGCLAGARTTALAAQPPQWAVGDSWKVGAWYAQALRPDDAKRSRGTHRFRGQPIAVTFEVTAVTVVETTQCYEIHVTYPPEQTGFQRLYRTYYCQQTGRLLRLRDHSLRSDGTVKEAEIDFPADANGPTLVDDVPGVVPLDWPDMTHPNTPPDTSQPPGTSQNTESSATNPAEDEVTLTHSSGQDTKKVVQRWRKGERWWRYASKYEGDRLISEAFLLEVNGVKVADMPKQKR